MQHKRLANARQALQIAFAASASAMRPMAATKIITNIGKGAGFVAHRRDGNVNAQHPSMIAIKPLEIRQSIGVGTSNKASSGGRIEPSVIMNPS